MTLRARLITRVLLCILGVAPCLWGVKVIAQAGDVLIRARPDFRNLLYDPAPTNAAETSLAQPKSVALFSGIAGAANDPRTPNDGLGSPIYLTQSGIGQAFGGGSVGFSSFGPPTVLVNGEESPSGRFTLIGTNVAQVQLLVSFTNGQVDYCLDCPDPRRGLEQPAPWVFPITVNPTSNVTVTLRAVAYDESFNEAEAEPVTITFIPVFSLEVTNTGGGGSFTATLPPGASSDTNGGRLRIVGTNGTVISVQANTNAGWSFLYWTNGATGTNPSMDFTLDRNLVAQGVFGTPLTTVVTLAATNGVIERVPDAAYYPYGSTVRLTAFPTNAIMFFRFWQNDANGQFFSPLDFTVIKSNPVVGARFAQLPDGNFALDLRVNGPGSVTRNPAQSNFTSGANVTLTATPVPGSRFVGWSGDAGGVNTQVNLTMSANKTVTANFTRPPVVEITSPVDQSVILNTDIPVAVEAADPDGFVAKLEIFRGTELVLMATNPPYTVTLSNTPPGVYLLTARATDNAGIVVTSAAVTVRLPLVISNISPTVAVPGATVVLTGANFSRTASNNIVHFGAVRAAVISASPEQILVIVPPGATFAPVSVTSRGSRAESLCRFLPTFSGAEPLATNLFLGPVVLNRAQAVRPASIELADLDNDGLADLFSGNYAAGPVDIFQNQSSSTSVSFLLPLTLAGATNYGLFYGAALPADLDLDGKFDLFYTDQQLERLYVSRSIAAPGLLNSNSFQPFLMLPRALAVFGAVMGDLDGDGLPDILTVNSGATVSILKNQSTPGSLSTNSFDRPITFAGFNGSMYPDLADLDGDGWPDIIVPNFGTNVVTILRHRGSPGTLSSNSFAAPVFFVTHGGQRSVKAVDLDGDGRLDLVTPNYYSNTVSVLRNTSTPGSIGFAPPVNLPTGSTPSHCAVADVNGDGKPDVIVAAEGGIAAIFQFVGLNQDITAESFLPRIDLTIGASALWVGAGDLNQDGRPELAFADWSGRTIRVFQNAVPVTSAEAPTISLNSPTNGASFVASSTLLLGATANDADGVVTNLSFFADGVLLGHDTNEPFDFAWTNAPVGSHSLTAVAMDDNGLSSTSSPPVNITVSEAQADPTFSMSMATYTVNENVPEGVVQVAVTKTANSRAGSVVLQTRNVSATAVPEGGGPGDYGAVSHVLQFAAGETSRATNITILNDILSEGSHEFEVFLTNATPGFISPLVSAIITILDDDVPPVTESVTNVSLPAPLPPATALLRVELLGAPVSGRWRFPWDLRWRTNGEVVTSLVPGNYPVEFKPVTGFFTPFEQLIPVPAGGTTIHEAVYVSDDGVPLAGSLRIVLKPSGAVESAGRWRFLGESTAYPSGQVVSNLSEGSHVIEFDPVEGWVKPALMVVTVHADLTTVRQVSYLVAETASGGNGPGPLNYDQVYLSTNAPNSYRPWWFNGQLQSDAGFSSGFVVKQRVVLTAAHALFDEANLTFVHGVRWFFQRQRGDYEAPPQTPRGWYVFGGYAAMRSNDMPGFSSLASRDLDVAALYFTEITGPPAMVNLPGRGGAAGFLVSTNSVNEWLTGLSTKTLPGYPMESVTEAQRGRMHRTPEGLLQFSQLTNQVYVSAGLFSHPGNSGGPLCVQHPNGYFYPAAVYLGGAGQTVVRAIDSQVVDLINRAEVSGNGGGNNTSGGILTILPPVGATSDCLGFARVLLDPASIAAGGGWRVPERNIPSGNPNQFTTSTTTRIEYADGTFSIVFKELPGYLAPTNRILQVTCGTPTNINASYLCVAPLSVNLMPPLAVAAGAAWRINGLGVDFTNATSLPVPQGGPYTVEFRPVPGFTTPASQMIQALCGQPVSVTGGYVPLPPSLQLTFTDGLSILGYSGMTYLVEWTNSLPAVTSSDWLPLGTVTLNSVSAVITNTRPTSNPPVRFFRARALP